MLLGLNGRWCLLRAVLSLGAGCAASSAPSTRSANVALTVLVVVLQEGGAAAAFASGGMAVDAAVEAVPQGRAVSSTIWRVVEAMLGAVCDRDRYRDRGR